MRFAALAAVLWLLTGCATDVTVRRGIVNGTPLVSLRLAPLDEVRAACLNGDAVACVYSTRIGNVPACHIETSTMDPYVIAHEVCHCVAGLAKLDRDPCHDEDYGRYRPR